MKLMKKLMNNRTDAFKLVDKLKDVAIIALFALAVYLIGRLWFEEISNRNFFYLINQTFFSNEPAIIDEHNTITAPYRIITNFGNSSYDIIYNGIEESAQKAYCDNAISTALKDGEFIASYDLDWNTVLRSRSYIYNYRFQIPSSLFVMNFVQTNNMLTSKVRFFNYVIVVPSRVISENIKVYFIDEPNNRYYEYSLSKSTLNQRMIDNIQQIQDKSGRLLYSSSKQAGLDMFNSNSFIPETGQYGVYYERIKVENPYKVNNELLLNSIEKKVTVFFNNPALITPGLTNDTIYTFSDEATVVKYYQSDVLEYSNYRVVDKRNSSTFNGDFNAAINFIHKDTEIINDFYLADFVEHEDGRRVFYFNYAISDMPMILSEDCRYETGLTHPIEITVENAWVTKYKKLVYNYSILEGATNLATLNYIDLISFSIDQTADDSEQIKLSDIMLCYKIDKKSPLSIYWYIRINNRSITRSA